MFKNLKIQKRLTKSFMIIAVIGALASVTGIVSTAMVATGYSRALTKYGFAQGDIGKAMVVLADARSATRATDWL